MTAAPVRSASLDATAAPATVAADYSSSLALASVAAVVDYNSSPGQALAVAVVDCSSSPGQALAVAAVDYNSSPGQALAADCKSSPVQASAVVPVADGKSLPVAADLLLSCLPVALFVPERCACPVQAAVFRHLSGLPVGRCAVVESVRLTPAVAAVRLSGLAGLCAVDRCAHLAADLRSAPAAQCAADFCNPEAQ